MSPGYQDAMVDRQHPHPPTATHYYRAPPTPVATIPCVRMCVRAGAISVKYGLIYLLWIATSCLQTHLHKLKLMTLIIHP